MPTRRPSPDHTVAPADRFRANQVDLAFEPVFEDLSAPVLLTHAGDETDRVFVVEQTGRILVGRVGGALSVFLDVQELIVYGGEQGLLGLAFHPDFAANRRFFVNYTNTAGDTIVAEYQAASPTRADPRSERVVLEIAQPYPNHNGGHLAFGPDGYLYIGMGDGGSAGDPEDRAQDLGSLLGKMLRIDVDSGGGQPEIWASGLRNPWRFSFDSETDALWIGDVGQDEVEEINRVRASRAGVNYGWDVMEGTDCYEPPSGCAADGLTVPVAEYEHELGCSVTGGYVYRGQQYPDLVGGYFFGDYCTGRVWVMDASDPRSGATELVDTDLSISSFGQDARGELYVTDLSGSVLRVVDRTG